MSGVHGISSGPCPRCGGELEFKASVGGLGNGSETYFFECKGCDNIHTVDEDRLDKTDRLALRQGAQGISGNAKLRNARR